MVRFRLRLQLQEFELPAGQTIVGRSSSCNVTIDDVLMSRDHAILRVTDGRVTLRDLGSRNGTWVNGSRIEDEIELHDGDRIRFGTTEIRFGRVVTPRRDLVTTASIRTCYSCGAPHVAQAPNCPRCGAPAGVGPSGIARSDSQRRRDFWLSLEVELLDKAIAMFRLDEAEASMRRLSEKLDGLIEARKTFEVAKVESALGAAVRFSHIRGTGRCIGWALDVLRRVEMLPGPELFANIAATPPILLEEAAEPLARLIASHRARTKLAPSEESCLGSLEKLHQEVVAFNRFRTMDTTPRSALAAIQ
jgi:hypothetical protein